MPSTVGFTVCEKHMVFDANSNLLFFVDKTTKNIVNDLSAGVSKDTILEKYENASEILKEIDTLKEEGKIFSPEIPLPKLYGEPPYLLKSMCINISHDCDMRCGYCFASTGDFGGERKLMSAEMGKKAIDFLIEHSGNREKLDVDFFGGEPLLNFDAVKEIILYMYKRGKEAHKKFKITVTTNVLSLSEEELQFLNTYGINLVLSLDGRKEVHDRVRRDRDGNGTYDRIVENIKRLVKDRDDLSYFVRGTYTKNALDFASDVKSMADEGFHNLSMEPVVLPKGHKLAITPEDFERIFAEYDRLTKLYLEYEKDDKKRFHFFHFNLDLDHGPCVHKRVSGCGAGSEYMAVTPEGDLYPCHQFVGDERFKLGNIETGIDREDIRKEFKSTHVYTKEACRDCFAKFLCSGGCHANAIYQENDIRTPYKIGCEIQKKRLQCALYIAGEKKLKEKKEAKKA